MTTPAEAEASLRDRTVLVTGATSGIGRATALAFGRARAHVLVSGRDQARGEETCGAVEAAGGRATLFLADLAQHEAVVELARAALDAANGRIDVLVNNAGAGFFAAAADVSREEFDGAYNLLVSAPFFLTAAIAPRMAEGGRGAIVNVTSAGTTRGIAGLSLFNSAKAALNALTLNWAAEYGPSGVNVNALNIGAIRTPVNEAHRGVVEAMVKLIPARRMGSAEEIADVIPVHAGGQLHPGCRAARGWWLRQYRPDRSCRLKT